MNYDTTRPGVQGPGSGDVPTAACLVQIYGGQLGRRYPLDSQHDATIGRDESNTVVLELPSVSRNHARAFERSGACYVVDLKSTNGTAVNGRAAAGEVHLTNGDLLKVGGAIFKFIEGGSIEALYHEEIYQLAILDGLTGLHNKRYFLAFLEREMARAARHDRPLSLALIDVDGFKETNDQRGHQAGDHVLQGLARVMEEQVRADELLVRYGGDEFAVILPETHGEEALAFCERLRAKVEETVFEFRGKPVQVTLSVGLAAMQPNYGLGDFVDAADAQLYRAKEAGRNRVATAE